MDNPDLIECWSCHNWIVDDLFCPYCYELLDILPCGC